MRMADELQLSIHQFTRTNEWMNKQPLIHMILSRQGPLTPGQTTETRYYIIIRSTQASQVFNCTYYGQGLQMGIRRWAMNNGRRTKYIFDLYLSQVLYFIQDSRLAQL